jgi:8-oxo-dGTP pyrophosphatase MutT (NUDIX family)
MASGEIPTVRHAARVVLLDERGRVLLVRFEYRGRSWWATPGGGLKEAETHEEAARREIREETGLDLEELGPWIWTREHVFRFERRLYRQRELYFLAVVPAFSPSSHLLGSEEAAVLRGLRWWTPDKLEATAVEDSTREVARARERPGRARSLTASYRDRCLESRYSTVTLLARLRGLSTSRPRSLATW